MYSYTITKHNKSNTITSLHRRYTLPSYVSASTLRGLVFTLTLVRRRRALSGAFRDVSCHTRHPDVIDDVTCSHCTLCCLTSA